MRDERTSVACVRTAPWVGVSSLWRWRMTRPVVRLLFVVAMIVVIVSLDVLFFRHRFVERLLVNIGIVLVFAAFYLRFLRQR